MARSSAARKKKNALNDLEIALEKSVKTVFGTIIFMKVEAAGDGDGKIEGERYTGSVAFWGETPGLLMLHVGAERAAKIAANVLGLTGQRPPAPESVRDAVGEVCALMAERLRSALAESHPSVVASLPTVAYGTDFDVSPGPKADRLQLSLRSDGDPIRVEYFTWTGLES